MHITRFDIPKEVLAIINKAIELEIMDVQDIFATAASFGDDWKAIVNEITCIAYSWIHVNTDYHNEICILGDRFYASVAKK